MKVEEINTKDRQFIGFLNRIIEGGEMLTLQEKCRRYVGNDLVDARYNDLLKLRRSAFMKYFSENNTEKRVSLLEEKSQIPYNWFSYYKINYKGDIPDELREAFEKLYDLNTEPPRRRYFQLRRR
jgi:hypothetical protein